VKIAAILSLSSLPSLLSLFSLLAGCNRTDAPPDLDARASTRQVRIFLVAIEEGAVPGAEAGCDGRIAPVAVDLPAPASALRGSIEALLAARDGHRSAGFYNALANSPLRLERIERAGATARIHLAGYLELGGDCDGSRALSQLTETATQFRDVDTAELFLDGQPLRELLAGKG
jgi:hypothetical protein